MAKKFYVVWAGRETGIFTDWPSCKRSIDKFAGARYKSFPTRSEAEAAFTAGGATRKVSSSSKKSSAGAEPAPPGSFHVEIYCDGGCDPNPGKAGSGCAVYHEGKLAELWYGLYDPCGTNNTAELNALHQSLLIAEKAIQEDKTAAVYCDSMYAINCISVWAYGWKKKGWKKSSGEIKNLALIQVIHHLYEGIKGKLQLAHVKAHCGIEGNELADRMTMLAVDREELGYVECRENMDIPALLRLRAG